MQHLPSVLIAAALTAGLVGQAVPEIPAVWREVTGVIDGVMPSNPQFRRAHIPAQRTTADGRILCPIEGGNGTEGTPRFGLMIPEKLTAPVPDSPAGAYTMSSPTYAWWQGKTFPSDSHGEFTNNTGPVSHVCIWDDAGPTNVGGNDEYHVKVLVTSNTDHATYPHRRTQFFVTPVKIVVANPKTVNAAITAVTRDGLTTAGPVFGGGAGGTPLFEASGFEPTIVGDGRLLIVRVYSPTLPFGSGTVGADIVYSHYSGGASADPTRWTTLLPISNAPADPGVNTTYPFAFQPFRDASGAAIAPGAEIGGSYPWMDRGAKNLLFEGVNEKLHYYQGGTWNNGRYPQQPVPFDPWAYYFSNPYVAQEDSGLHQGVTVMGLWTRGKMVQLDNLNNDMDYAIGTGDGVMFPEIVTPTSPPPQNLGPQQRLVTLYQGGPAHVVAQGSQQLRLGYGRATQRMPLGENDNGNIIDSIENKLNYRTLVQTQSFHEVAWHLGNSKQIDELAFDDMLDPDAVIVASMAGLLTLRAAVPGQVNELFHHSGWDDQAHAFLGPVRLQNAATTTQWNVPAFGLVTGPGRLEPAAAGGQTGKGFWMNGAIGLDFTMPLQATGAVAGHDWYCGLFVDCRFADDGVERRLVTFPDGSSIRLHGRRQILYATGNDVVVGRITLPPALTGTPGVPLDDLLPNGGWAHLAFQIRQGGKDVEFLLDGLPFSRWMDPQVALFQPINGHLVLGNQPGSLPAGFRGWIDDFQLLAHTVDPETACNHAGGTLLGLPSTYTGVYKTSFANRYPAWAHDEIRAELRNRGEKDYPLYANFVVYHVDGGASVSKVPAGTVSLRQSVHFPEGPLFHNAPRPDTQQNTFCTSCHSSSGLAGLGLTALTYNGLNATNDRRRQPSQPPARLFGWLAPGQVQGATGNQPATGMIAPVAGQLVDPWLLPSFAGPSVVQTFTVLDALTGRDLVELHQGDQLDPARLGTGLLRLRANLDSAQGSVVLQLDGQTVSPVTSPYTIPAAPAPGIVLAAGAHTLQATPSGGTTVGITFTVAGASVRTIANYRDDFQTGNPGNGWVYCWNPAAAINVPGNYRHLAWQAGSGNYTALGLAYPETTTADGAFVALSATGGHPGRGTTQGAASDRWTIAGYRVKVAGYHGIGNGTVTSVATSGSNGLQAVVYVQTGTTMTRRFFGIVAGGTSVTIPQTSFGWMNAGDMVWVAVGPNGSDTSDAFQWNFDVRYWEQSF